MENMVGFPSEILLKEAACFMHGEHGWLSSKNPAQGGTMGMTVRGITLKASLALLLQGMNIPCQTVLWSYSNPW